MRGKGEAYESKCRLASVTSPEHAVVLRLHAQPGFARREQLLDPDEMKFNGMRCSSSDAVCVQLTFHSLWTVSAEGTTSIGYILRVRAHENE